MNNKLTSFFCISYFLLQLPIQVAGQVLVDRCKVLNQSSPIHNIWVDKDNIKWVANSQGLFKVFSLDRVEKVEITSGITSFLTLHGGNAKLEWNTSEMQQLTGDVQLTCVSYDPKSKTIWIGTEESGAFQITLYPLHIVQRLNTENHKLISNKINDIFITTTGKTYFATNGGILMGSGNHWTLQKQSRAFVDIIEDGQNLLILGDDSLWKVNSKGKWSSIDIDLKHNEGQLHDITVDQKGRIWLASNIVTGYDIKSNKYQCFGPDQNFKSQFINCLDVDKDGSIWIGTADKGLYFIQWDTSLINVTDSKNTLPLIAKISMVNNIICAGQPNASLKAEVSGGKQPYTYSWTGMGKNMTGETINNLIAGKYVLNVTDMTGASSSAQSEITEPKELTITTESISSASMENSEVNVILKVSGGTIPYSYNGKVWPDGITSYKIEKLVPGDYILKISDAHGCSNEVNVKVSESTKPLSIIIKQTKQILCSGRPEAELEASVRGGKPPYTYMWASGQSDSTLLNVSEGKYVLNVTDRSGQKRSVNFIVTGPAPLATDIADLRPATNDRINDGKAIIRVRGGSPPYSYRWDSGETKDQAIKLPLGTGLVTVRDTNGCMISSEYIIHEKVLPELTAARLASGEPIRMEKIQFEADSVRINPEAVPTLEELYDFLYDNPSMIIEVSGHTNSLPDDEYCDLISSQRAKSVADYLINKGIAARRVISKGYGKRKPVTTNQTPEGRKRNQRVEIKLIKIEE